jgi:hypothetical protein
MQMYVVVDFGCNRGGDAGTLHLIDEACPKQRIWELVNAAR